MIIECPSCLTRYDTPAQIPEEGRNVRCAKCANVWLVKPDDKPSGPDPLKAADKEAAEAEEPTVDESTKASSDAVEEAEQAAQEEEPTVDEGTMASAQAVEEAEAQEDDADAEPEDNNWLEDDEIDWGDDDGEIEFAVDEEDGEAASEAPEPEVAAEPEPESEVAAEPAEPETAPEEEPVEDDQGEAPPIVIPDQQPPAETANPRMIAGWAGLAVFVLLTAVLIVTQRVGVVSALPGAASLYKSVGLSVNVRGLDFDKVTSTWTVEAGRSILEIHGDIVNITDASITVPTVVFALRNAKGLEVYQWAAEVSNEPLAGGERTPFVARIPTPPKSIKSVQVKFAKSR